MQRRPSPFAPPRSVTRMRLPSSRQALLRFLPFRRVRLGRPLAPEVSSLRLPSTRAGFGSPLRVLTSPPSERPLARVCRTLDLPCGRRPRRERLGLEPDGASFIPATSLGLPPSEDFRTSSRTPFGWPCPSFHQVSRSAGHLGVALRRAAAPGELPRPASRHGVWALTDSTEASRIAAVDSRGRSRTPTRAPEDRRGLAHEGLDRSASQLERRPKPCPRRHASRVGPDDTSPRPLSRCAAENGAQRDASWRSARLGRAARSPRPKTLRRTGTPALDRRPIVPVARGRSRRST